MAESAICSRPLAPSATAVSSGGASRKDASVQTECSDQVAELQLRLMALEQAFRRSPAAATPEARITNEPSLFRHQCPWQLSFRGTLKNGNVVEVAGVRVPDRPGENNQGSLPAIITCAHDLSAAIFRGEVTKLEVAGESDVYVELKMPRVVFPTLFVVPEPVSSIDMAAWFFPPRTALPAKVMGLSSIMCAVDGEAWLFRKAADRKADVGRVEARVAGKGLLVHSCNTDAGYSGAPLLTRRNGKVSMVGLHLGCLKTDTEVHNVAVPSQFVVRFLRAVGVAPSIMASGEGLTSAFSHAVSGSNHHRAFDDDEYEADRRAIVAATEHAEYTKSLALDAHRWAAEKVFLLTGGEFERGANYEKFLDDEAKRSYKQDPSRLWIPREKPGERWADMESLRVIVREILAESAPTGPLVLGPRADASPASSADPLPPLEEDATLSKTAKKRALKRARKGNVVVLQGAVTAVPQSRTENYGDLYSGDQQTLAFVVEKINTGQRFWACNNSETTIRPQDVFDFNPVEDCGAWALRMLETRGVSALIQSPRFYEFSAAQYRGSSSFADFRDYVARAQFEDPVPSVPGLSKVGRYETFTKKHVDAPMDPDVLKVVSDVLGKDLPYAMPATDAKALLRSVEVQLKKRQTDRVPSLNAEGVGAWSEANLRWHNYAWAEGALLDYVDGFFDGLDRDASAGWTQYMPGTGGNTKGQVLGSSAGRTAVFYHACCRLILLLSTPLEDVATATPGALVAMGLRDPEMPFIKPEAHPKAKIEEGRLRLIWASSLVDITLQAIMQKDYTKVLHQHYDAEGAEAPLLAVGLGHHDEGIQHFAKILQIIGGKAGRVWSSDATGFDFGVLRDMQLAAYANRADKLLPLYQDERFNDTVRCAFLKLALVHSAHCLGLEGGLYDVTVFGVVGSGLLTTGPDDGQVRSLAYYSTVYEKQPVAARAARERTPVLAICNGDDMAAAVALDNSAVEYMRLLGVTTKPGYAMQDLYNGVEYTSHLFQYSGIGLLRSAKILVGPIMPDAPLVALAEGLGLVGPVKAEFLNLEKACVGYAQKVSAKKNVADAVAGLEFAMRHSACLHTFRRVVCAVREAGFCE